MDIDNYLDNIDIDISMVLNNNFNKILILFDKDKDIPVVVRSQKYSIYM